MTAPEPAYAPPVCGLCGVRLVFDDMRASWMLRFPLSQRGVWLDADYDDGDHGDPGCCAEGTYGEGLAHLPAMLTADQAWDEPLPKRTVRLFLPHAHMALTVARPKPTPNGLGLSGFASTLGGGSFEATFDVRDATPLADLLRGGMTRNDVMGDGLDGILRQRLGLDDVVEPRTVDWPWLPDRVRHPAGHVLGTIGAHLAAWGDDLQHLAERLAFTHRRSYRP